jgi:2-methylaconitate cis-trans-isomerase PrpF
VGEGGEDLESAGKRNLLVPHALVDGESGRRVFEGEAGIDGVPGTRAPILMDFRGVGI